MLREAGHDPVILRGGMGAKTRAAALAWLQPQPGGPPRLAVATGPYVGEGFDCAALGTLFLAAPVASKDSLILSRSETWSHRVSWGFCCGARGVAGTISGCCCRSPTACSGACSACWPC
jgi:hypothetical protein